MLIVRKIENGTARKISQTQNVFRENWKTIVKDNMRKHQAIKFI